jgi:hypothetical protein
MVFVRSSSHEFSGVSARGQSLRATAARTGTAEQRRAAYGLRSAALRRGCAGQFWTDSMRRLVCFGERPHLFVYTVLLV